MSTHSVQIAGPFMMDLFGDPFNMTTLPIRLHSADKRALLSAGVRFFGPHEHEDYQSAELPHDWTHEHMDRETDVLKDGKGRPRAYIQRSFGCSPMLECVTRFSTEIIVLKEGSLGRHPCDDEPAIKAAVALDCGREIYRTEIAQVMHGYEHLIEPHIEAEAMSWLDERYPNWRDPALHWD